MWIKELCIYIGWSFNASFSTINPTRGAIVHTFLYIFIQTKRINANKFDFLQQKEQNGEKLIVKYGECARTKTNKRSGSLH